ncbi:N-acetylmuramoyl-L-alanine amidase [Planomicrobium sp. YIM 101495]|uniref:N-acetylmuramoyl-L-alanine amidase n=1 Tax=Planomicrobium sp. YIM 101495 TaxID=2665160 RepID=UPI00351A5BA4
MVLKKWIVLLCFMLIASVFVPFSPAKASSHFTDVGNTHRAHAEISYLVNKGIANGYSDNRFNPARQVTRAEAAAMLGRALNLNGSQRNTPFTDVGKGNMASGYIVEMSKKGIISGYPDGSFQPNKVLKRGEMALLIGRAFNMGTTVSAASKSLMDKGIAQGLPGGSFGTELQIIRADFSVFLARTLNADFRVKPGEVSFGTTMYVNTGSDTLNMRSGPGTSHRVISSLKHATVVGVGTVSNGWAHVKVNNVIGYVSYSYLTTSKPGSVLPSPPPSAASDLTVIIDPGHGAHDPGGVGYGHQEKNVVLNIGRHMKSYFDMVPINAKMTRNSDVFVTLQDRAKFASRNDGDIFVSLHTNALNGAANGQETFYYAKTAANNTNVQQSRALAIYLQERMQETWPLRDRGVNPFGYGNFAVLRENTVPAALVEMGFIDSSIDIKYINNEAHRKAMGKALFLGTLDYFYHYEGRTDVLPYYKTVGATVSKKHH